MHVYHYNQIYVDNDLRNHATMCSVELGGTSLRPIFKAKSANRDGDILGVDPDNRVPHGTEDGSFYLEKGESESTDLMIYLHINPRLINPRLFIGGAGYHFSCQLLFFGGTTTINQPGSINPGLILIPLSHPLNIWLVVSTL